MDTDVLVSIKKLYFLVSCLAFVVAWLVGAVYAIELPLQVSPETATKLSDKCE